jgi:hypothetical protein
LESFLKKTFINKDAKNYADLYVLKEPELGAQVSKTKEEFITNLTQLGFEIEYKEKLPEVPKF